jgi:flagellar hook-length control protein FliK
LNNAAAGTAPVDPAAAKAAENLLGALQKAAPDATQTDDATISQILANLKPAAATGEKPVAAKSENGKQEPSPAVSTLSPSSPNPNDAAGAPSIQSKDDAIGFARPHTQAADLAGDKTAPAPGDKGFNAVLNAANNMIAVNNPTQQNQPATPVAAAQVTAAPLHAHMSPVADQVAFQISKSLKNGMDRIKVQLSPEDLGRVEVRLDVQKDGTAKAVISADKPETLQWLQRDAKSLERSLQDAGFKLDNSNMSFNLKQDSGSQFMAFADRQNQQSNPGHNGYGHAKHEVAGLIPEAAIISYHNTGANGVDIRV